MLQIASSDPRQDLLGVGFEVSEITLDLIIEQQLLALRDGCSTAHGMVIAVLMGTTLSLQASIRLRSRPMERQHS